MFPRTFSRTRPYAFPLLVNRLETAPYAFREFVMRAASFTSSSRDMPAPARTTMPMTRWTFRWGLDDHARTLRITSIRSLADMSATSKDRSTTGLVLRGDVDPAIAVAIRGG